MQSTREKLKEELLRLKSEGKHYVYVPCTHGTAVWEFNVDDLLSWLEGHYEIYTTNYFCDFVVANVRTGKALKYEEYGAPKVRYRVRELLPQELQHLRHLRQDKDDVIRIMLLNTYVRSLLGHSSRAFTVTFPP